jgi:hypothetical protein
MPKTREVARYAVELRWRAPRKWGDKNLPHGGRFYAWVLLESPQRRLYTYVEATGIFAAGGVESTELAILTSGDGPVPDLLPGESFKLSLSGVEPFLIAAYGRVLATRSESN